MSRVAEESLKRLKEIISSLPEEIKNKCSLCSTTLTHIVKKMEVETGAGTATVTRVLAGQINENAKPADKVTAEALRQRVLNKSGEKSRICSNGTDKPEVDPPTWRCAACGREYDIHIPKCLSCEQEDKKSIALEPQIVITQKEIDDLENYEKNKALVLADKAISMLSGIQQSDPCREGALIKVREWTINQLHLGRVSGA